MLSHLGIRALGLVLLILAMILVDQGADAVTFEEFKTSLDNYMTTNVAKTNEACDSNDDKTYKKLDNWRKVASDNETSDPDNLKKMNDAFETLKGKVCPRTPDDLRCHSGNSTCIGHDFAGPGPISGPNDGSIPDECIDKFNRNDDVGPACWEKAEASFPASGPILTFSLTLTFGIPVLVALFKNL